jgi:putative addiction module component (TIGR02574 family)
MDRSTTLAQVLALSIDDRVWMIHAILDSIANGDARGGLSEAQKQELDRRIADMDANPDDEIPWDQVYADSLKRVRR